MGFKIGRSFSSKFSAIPPLAAITYVGCEIVYSTQKWYEPFLYRDEFGWTGASLEGTPTILGQRTPEIANKVMALRPAPIARRTWLVLAPAIVLDRTQPIPRSRGVRPYATAQRGCHSSVTLPQRSSYENTTSSEKPELHNVLHAARGGPSRGHRRHA